MSGGPFAASRLQTILCVTDRARAERFYSEVLGLAPTGESFGALVYDVGGSDLRVSPVPTLTPFEHTQAGFAVADLEAAAERLAAHGVATERFEGFPHDDRGFVALPGGARVFWFRDPDGNLLSAVQYG